MEVFWLEVQPWNPATDAAEVLRFCNVDFSAVVNFGGNEWLPLLDAGIVFDTQVYSGQFIGKAEVTRGEVTLLVNDAETDELATYAWTMRPAKIWTGTIDTSNPLAPVWPTAQTLLFDGLAVSFDPDDGLVALTSNTPNGKIANAEYAGTGDGEGQLELKGTVKPFAAGTHKNRPATIVLPNKLLFQVHGYGEIQAFTNFREGGIVLDQPVTNHATLAALLAATVPATQIHTCRVAGAFRLGFVPYADITVDFDGHKRAAGWSNKVADIALALLERAGWNMAKIDAASFAAVNTAFPHPCQFYDDFGIDVLEALTQLMSSVGGYWDVDELGNLYVGIAQRGVVEDFTIGDEGTAQFDLLEIDHQVPRAPFYKTRVGYGYNPSVIEFRDSFFGATQEQLDTIESVQDLVDGTVAIYFATVAPTGGGINDNDLWHDTDDGLWYKRVSGAWALTAGLGALGEALLAAAGAQAAADGKITTYYRTTDPNPTFTLAVGDLWIDSDENPKRIRRWNGAGWDTVSQLAAQVTTDTPNINVSCDSGGTPNSGVLPLTVDFVLVSNGANYTSGVTWTYKVLTGTVNGFTASSAAQAMTGAGAGTFTLTTLATTDASIEVTGTHTATGTIGKITVPIAKVLAAPAPPTSGGSSGSTSAQTSGFLSINSSTFTTISNVLEYVQGASDTTLDVVVALDLTPSKTGGDGSWTVELKVQRETSPGVYTDQGSTVSASSSVETVDYSEPPIVKTVANKATFNFTRNITGLTGGTTQKIRIQARLVSGTRTHATTGQVTLQ